MAKVQNRPVKATIEAADLRFRNFEGKGGAMNRQGDRNFAVFISPETAAQMESENWPVKYLQPREEGDPQQAMIRVKVKMDGPRPPQINLMTSAGRSSMTEDDLGKLDWAYIKNADIVISQYPYEFNGKTGITIYLDKMFVTLEEDDLDRKYADIYVNTPESAQMCVGPDCDF